jgi:hypothetical protein
MARGLTMVVVKKKNVAVHLLTMNTGGNNVDRRPFNSGRNTQFCYNPGHDRGRVYGGYARGWQRQTHPGDRYSGSRLSNGHGRVECPNAYVAPHANTNPTPANRQGPGGGHVLQQNTVTPHSEPSVPEVFKNQKPGKAKVEEGHLGEGNKSFCFRCYKPGHGILQCTAKLLCEICGSNDHLTGRCPILKQPRLMAHPCGYDVSRLGFYHIPHAPINVGKTNNTKSLVTVHNLWQNSAD